MEKKICQLSCNFTPWPSTCRASHGRKETVWLLATYLIVQPHLWKGPTCVLHQSMSVLPQVFNLNFTSNSSIKGGAHQFDGQSLASPLKIATIWRPPYFQINPHHIVTVGCVSHYILPSTYQHYDTPISLHPKWLYNCNIYICVSGYCWCFIPFSSPIWLELYPFMSQFWVGYGWFHYDWLFWVG